jgi:hypothetical protein
MGEAKKIEITNFLLIWVTLFFAFQFPFQLFLFSYAVLGPLHYLTEINWLDKKNYFLAHQNDKKHYLKAAIVSLLLLTITFAFFELGKWEFTKPLQVSMLSSNVAEPLNTYTQWSFSALFLIFIFAVAFVATPQRTNRLLIIGICALSTLFLYKFTFFAVCFGILLPTIIHVFLFTILFMWSGAKKSKSTWGYVNVVSMIFVLIVISAKENLILPSDTSQSTFETFIATNFHQVNYALTRMLGHADGSNWNLQLPIVWKVQTFIAFAYTYHYLNWFSKTSIIQWHKVNKRKMAITLSLWIACCLMFYFNYRIGLAAIYVLSMLHIILEFPLNISSIKSLLRSEEIITKK